MAETAATNGTKPEKSHVTKPDKPDDESYKAALAEAEKIHNAVMTKLNAIKAKLDIAQPSKDKDSPQAKRREELRTELKSIRDQQSQFKSSRGNNQDKIASLDAQLKSRLAEQKTNRARIPFKSAEDVEREIQRLQKQVDAGTMKIVDEKKALAEMSTLNRTKKSFAGFDDAEKQIAKLKGEISEIRKSMDNPEQKSLSERYSAIQKELDGLKAEQDDVYKNLNSLRDERSKLQDEQKGTWAAIREVKDKYFAGLRAFKDYEGEARKQRQEKFRQERDASNRERRKRIATEKLDTASQPAYIDQILSAEGLIRYFDPSVPTEAKVLRGPSGMAAEAQRTVDASQLKGTVLSKKEDRDESYFVGSGGKKGKKGRKGGDAATAPASGEKFNLSIGVIEELGKVDVDPPSNQADVPGVVEKLQAKVAKWKAEQDDKTKENVSKAQAEIDKLEAEAAAEDAAAAAASSSSTNVASKSRSHDSAKKPSQANAGVNGNASADAELKQETDAAKDVAEDLKAAKLEDAKDAEKGVAEA